MIIESLFKSTFEYNENFRYFCLKNCVKQLLNYHKVDHALAYLNCAPCMHVIIKEKLSSGYAIWFNKNPLLDIFMDCFTTHDPKIKTSAHNFPDIIHKIDCGVPVIASTDVFYLPYKKNYYLKHHASHALIIGGYDDSQKQLYIVDYYDQDKYQGTLSYKDFFDSWSSANPSEENPFSGYAINNVWSVLHTVPSFENVANIVKITMDRAISNFFGKDVTYGFRGIEGLMRLKNWLNDDISANGSTNIGFLHKSLYMYYREKILFFHYFKSLGQHLGKAYNDILYFMDNNITKWNIFLTFLLKTNIAKMHIDRIKLDRFYLNILESEFHLYSCLVKSIKG
ncbi:MAG: BtrH N-terminal domain-containing protein [Clostridia bacterium]|nr:BtrH N-terminal domain-containing protein [Clostridia bacterium]